MSFSLDRAALVMAGVSGCGYYHLEKGWEKLQLPLSVSKREDLKNGPAIITVEEINFIIDESLPTGAWYDKDWYDKETKTIAFNSALSKLWHFNRWSIHTDKVPTEFKKAAA